MSPLLRMPLRQLLFFSVKMAVVVGWLCMALPQQVSAQTTESVPIGSFIINMGVQPQTVANGLKPYGLMHQLLREQNVPIKWVINPTKGKDGIDFTYNSVPYRGGAFIIYAGYRTPAVNAIISNWQTQGVQGITTTSELTVPVYTTISYYMNWTLDAKNGSIAQGFLVNAGIPSNNWNWVEPNNLNCCNDVFVMPHADPTWATHQRLLSWNDECDGAIWAGCHAVSVLENIANPGNPAQRMNYLMSDGPTPTSAAVLFGDHGDGSIPPPYLYAHHTHPVMQFLGTIDAATQNGSEQIFLPKISWRPSTFIGVWDDSQADVPAKSPGPAAVLAFGQAFGDNNRGRVIYQGSHSINKGTAPANIAAQRAFFNFSFWASQSKAIIVSLTTPMNMYVSIPVTVSATASGGGGGPYTYEWISSCPGTFLNPNAATTTFTPTGSSAGCVISCRVRDNCGTRVGFNSSGPIVINPAAQPPVAVNDNATVPTGCGTGGSVTIDPLANDSDADTPKGDLTITLLGNGTGGTFVLNLDGTVTYTSNPNFAGTDQVQYQLCDPGNLCSTATITVSVGQADIFGCLPNQIYAVESDGGVNAVISSVSVSGTLDDVLNFPDALTVEMDNNSDELILGFGEAINVGDTLVLYLKRGDNSNPTTITVERSPDGGTNFFNLQSINITSTAVLAYNYIVAGGNLNAIRLKRTAGKPNVDAVIYAKWRCLSAVPNATNDLGIIALEDFPVIVDVLANDVDPRGEALTVTNIITPPANGGVSINPNSTITYIASLDYAGDDSFVYEVCNTSGYCAQATVFVKVLEDGCLIPGQTRPTQAASIPSSTTLTATEDTELTNNNVSDANKNYGSCDKIHINGSATTPKQRSLIRFNLSSIPSDAVITSATLQLTKVGGSNTAFDISVHRVTADWTEGTGGCGGTTGVASWNNRMTSAPWTTAGGDFNASAEATTSVAGNAVYSWSVTSLVQGWVNGTQNNFGVLLKFATENVNAEKDFASSENGTAANRPRLVISYTSSIATVSFSSTAVVDDAFINQDKPNENKGTDTEMKIGKIPNKVERIVMRFDLSTIPAGSIITSATLQVNRTSSSKAQPYALHRVTESWTEGGVRWVLRDGTNNWTTPGGTFIATPFATFNPGTTTGIKQVGVTSAVQYWVDNPAQNFGLLAKREVETLGDDEHRWGSSENGTADRRPVLTVTYTTLAPCQAVPNRAPLARPDFATTNSVTPVTVTVKANDTDPDNNPLTVTSIVEAPPTGTAILNGDQTITYTPNPTFNGKTSFTYQVCDNGAPALCNIARVTITVLNSPPVANNDNATVSANSNVTINVQANDSDPENKPLVTSIVTSPGFGTVALSGNNIVYTPLANYSGPDAFQYQVCEIPPPNSCDPPFCSTATVNVTVSALPPDAIDDTKSVNPCQQVFIDVLANDVNPLGGPLTLTITTQPANGTAVVTGGQVLYVPTLGYNGPLDAFTYQICNNLIPAQCDQATVLISFNFPIVVNNPPNANDDTETITSNIPGYVQVLANDTEPDGNEVNVTVGGSLLAPANGTVSVLPNKQIVYIPNQGFSGTDVFQYQICDVHLTNPSCVQIPTLCDIATVFMTVQNQPPVAVDDFAITPINNPVNIAVLPNDFDPDNDSFGLTGAGTNGLNGSTNNGGLVSVNNNGTPGNPTDDYIVYTPPFNFTGIDNFIYTICDNGVQPACSQANVTVYVTPAIDLEVSKTVSPTNALIGQNVTFTITVTNTSTVQATGVAILDKLPTSFTHVSNNGAGTYDPFTGVWFVGTLNAVSSKTLTIVATVNNYFDQNVAQVYAANQYDIDSSPNNFTGTPLEDDEAVASVNCASLSASVSGTTPAGCTVPNGTITLNVSGGNSPYSYFWNNGITTGSGSGTNIGGLTAGAYNITVYDNVGCNRAVTATVGSGSAPSISGMVTHVNCFGGSTGAINLSITGGTTPYTYLWSTGATIEDIGGLTAGTYSVTVTENGGCSTNSSFTVNQSAANCYQTTVIKN